METPPRVLGIDYGRRRVGIAVSDPLGIIARGVTVLERTRTLAADICRLAAELGAGTLVVGMPLTLRGTKGEIAAEVEEFIAALERTCGLPVIAVDERFSSSRARSTQFKMGVPKKKRRIKTDIDRMAAALILQDYLDRRSAPDAAPPA
ncbi:MAG TPA: Holliday junction resolvase RuvX [Bacteroidota bacterium]|nr:Holliday junction resolvase RuvX [Bacteroidota bacterium]